MEVTNAPRVQRVVNKRYKRDLLLLFLISVGVMIITVLIVTFLKPHFKALDNVEPEIPTCIIILLLIIIAVLKYARKK